MVKKPAGYGVWNSVTKRFVFGICEDNADRAWRKFKRMVVEGTWRKWRYDTKKIPSGWINPPNPYWTNKG